MHKTILITGASSGIGEAYAKLIASEGVKIILQARSVDKLEALTKEIKERGGTAFSYPTDLSDIQAVKEQAAKIKQEVGIPDIIINSAGAGNWLTIFDTSEKDFEDMQRRVPGIDKIKQMIGFEPKTDLDAILAKVLDASK